MQLGYARVSTDDQATAAQLDALRAAGCGRVFEERASGGRWDRPELHRMLDQLRQGDVVVVWRLDRLSRSLKDLLSIMEKIDGRCRIPVADRSHRHDQPRRADDDADGGRVC